MTTTNLKSLPKRSSKSPQQEEPAAVKLFENFRGIASHKEKDQDRFFGRGPEITEVCNMLRDRRIVVLSGASGSGKTSLLLAGVVPSLRRLRLLDTAPYQVGFPIVLREWGAIKKDVSGAHETDLPRFAAFIEQTIEEYADRPDDGLKAMLEQCRAGVIKKVPEEKFEQDINQFQAAVHDSKPASSEQGLDRLVDVVAKITAKCGGLTLIFDQLEELLRVNSKFINAVSQTINALYSVRGVRIILSLREEYRTELRRFELIGGVGLEQSHVYVKQLEKAAAQRVFEKICEDINKRYGHEVISVDPHIVDHLEANIGVQELTAKELDAPSEADRTGVELMYLSGIVRQLVRKWEERGEGGVCNLNREALEREFGQEQPINTALRSIFDDCFPADKSKGFRRFVAARIASGLTSGGYKLTQQHEHLFTQAFGQRITYLYDFEVRAALARLKEWTKSATQAEEGDRKKLEKLVVDEFEGCMNALEKAEIVKRFQAPKAVLWELTHDRLGKPFLDWAQEQQHTFEDCVADPLGSRGVSPIKLPKTGIRGRKSGKDREEFFKLVWLGCYLEPEQSRSAGAEASESETAFIKDIVFNGCDFSGTAFDNVIFDNCKFLNCRFDGALFKRCTFKSTTFEGIGKDKSVPGGGYTIGFLGCTFSGRSGFTNCNLIQPAFAPHGSKEARVFISIEGELSLRGVVIQLGSFEGLNKKSAGSLKFDDKSHLRWTMWDETFKDRVSIGADNLYMSGRERGA